MHPDHILYKVSYFIDTLIRLHGTKGMVEKKKTKNIIEKNQLVDKISHSIGKDQMCDIRIHCSWGLDVKDEMSNEHVPNENIY